MTDRAVAVFISDSGIVPDPFDIADVTVEDGPVSTADERRAVTPRVDIVVPVYNEEAILESSICRLREHLIERVPVPWRIVIADNASTDGTAAIATRLAGADDRIVHLHLDQKGRGRALRAAWSASDADVVAYTDVDLSTGLTGLLPLVAPLVSGHSDLAIGSRLSSSSVVARGPKRELISRCYNQLLRLVFAVRFRDAQCGFKAGRADVVQLLLPAVEDEAWFFDTELLLLAEYNGLRVHEVPVDWIDDPDSRVDVRSTAMADLRGVRRMAWRFARGRASVDLGEHERQPLADDFGRQTVTYASIGLVSTAVSLVIFLLLRDEIGAVWANVVGFTATAIGNNWANRRWTFHRRSDEDRRWRMVTTFTVFADLAARHVAGAGRRRRQPDRRTRRAGHHVDGRGDLPLCSVAAMGLPPMSCSFAHARAGAAREGRGARRRLQRRDDAALGARPHPVAAAQRTGRGARDGRPLRRRHLRRRPRVHRRRRRHPAHDRPPRAPTSATAATRRPGTATPSITAGTSWSCSTATVSTRRRRCPICSRRSPTAIGVDAVFGSRMLDPGGARRGGMPLYKYVGNRILTRTQNVIAGVRLSEWHSGYRAYRVSALADLPFVGNSDGFDFDTEIILQLLGAHAGSSRSPIPTYYGDEISRVNGIAYARDIVLDTVRHRLGEVGFGRGDLGHKDEPYAYKPSPDSSHGIVLELVPDDVPLRVLDVGCGPGWVAAELRRRGHHVTGVDLLADEGVTERTDRFFEADLEHGLPDEVGGGFDVVIAADVIEHVRNPDVLLADLAGRTSRTRDDRRQRAELRPLVPARADRGGAVRLRPARHPRPHARPLLHAAELPPGGRQHRPGHDGRALRRAAARRPRGGGRARARLVAVVDRVLRTVWPTMFAYQFVVKLETAPALLDPS